MSGIMSALILQEIDEMFEGQVMRHVSHVVGTCTGAVLALGLSCNKVSRPKTPRQMVDVYEKLAKEALGENMEHGSLFCGSKYLQSRIEQFVQDEFGLKKNKSLSSVSCAPHFACVAYKISEERCDPFLFRSYRVTHVEPRGTTNGKQVPVLGALRATLASPSYSKPVQMGTHKFVGGGASNSNPTLVAIEEIVQLYPNLKKMGVISIGNGYPDIKCPANTSKTINLQESMNVAAESEKVYQRVEARLTALKLANKKTCFQYWRLNPALNESIHFSEEWIQKIKQIATNYLKHKKSVIQDICTSLKDYNAKVDNTNLSNNSEETTEVDREIVDLAVENRIHIKLFNLKGSCANIILSVGSKEEMWSEIREDAKCINPNIEIIVEYQNSKKIISNVILLKHGGTYYALERKELETLIC